MSVTPLRMVIGFVGGVLLLCVVLIGLLALNGKPIPDVLQNVAVGSLASLGTLLVPSRSQDGPPAS